MQNNLEQIKTEGIKYAGSKREILSSIVEIAKKLGSKSVFDGFSGTTRVSQAFAKFGFKVWANDISDWSFVFGQCYLHNQKNPQLYEEKIAYLNSLQGCTGWFTENYGGSACLPSSIAIDGKKKMWQIHNTQKLDAIRDEIDRISENPIEKSVFLSSLILAMDRVDNSVGHHASYLKTWSTRSYREMKLEIPIFPTFTGAHKVTQADIFDLIASDNTIIDLAYFDPPYGSSNERMPASRVRYASYYHIWTSIIRNDRPQIVGAANRRADVSDLLVSSVFEEFRRSSEGRYFAVEAIEKLLQQTQARHIIFSYNNEGRASLRDLTEACNAVSDDFQIFERTHKSHVMKSMNWTREWMKEDREATKEFIFVLSKDGKLPDLN